MTRLDGPGRLAQNYGSARRTRHAIRGRLTEVATVEGNGKVAMAGTTPLTIGADVTCTDGVGGKVSRLVVDPRAHNVTHLVVNDRQFQGRLIPLNLPISLRATRGPQATDPCPRERINQERARKWPSALMTPSICQS